jgi:uncharacterized coiled-coil protein SlyX
MTTLRLRESIGRTARRRDLLLTLAALACFALPATPKAFAVSPAPDGGYPGSNTAEGSSALLNLSSGISNTAVGFQVLYLNTTGNYNTAIGAKTMQGDKGAQNTGTGYNALIINHSGSYNTANGANALYGDPHSNGGSNNTGIGQGALYVFLGAIENTAIGVSSLASNDRGAQNTAVGFKAFGSHRSPQNAIALGHEAGIGRGGLYDIEIGTPGGAVVYYTTRIGDGQTRTFIAGISGIPVVGDTVVVNGNGRLGTATSSARFKKKIKPMGKASEAILALKPVSFQYKSDTKATRQFGLIAEEVAKVNPDLVTRDRQGEIYSVRYESVNAMLLNEFLKQHKALLEEQRKVQEQQATIAQLKSTVAQQQKDFEKMCARLTARLDEQTSQLENVSAQVKANVQGPQMVSNSQ